MGEDVFTIIFFTRYLATESEVFVIFLIWKVMVITLNPDDIKVPLQCNVSHVLAITFKYKYSHFVYPMISFVI